jgi:glycosyltransferase involved in cell wall biosynthesis
MRVLAFGTYDVRTHPRVGVLIEGLREHGDEVVEVNEPLGLDTATRVAILRQPWRLPLLAWRLLRCWAVLAARARRAPAPDAVLVGYLGHFDVRLARRLFRGVPVALDFLVFASDTARDRGETGGVKGRLMQWIDESALRAADIVVVDTAEHLERLPERHRAKGVVVPVGAPTVWFDAGAARPDPGAGSPLRVVFFGLFTPLQGTPTVGRALGLLADTAGVESLMVGRGQDLEAARAAATGGRVTWRDWVPADELPGLVAAYDVCLGVFGTGPKALRVVPNKVFQGAAAGCAIVTSDTAPQRRVLGDSAVLVPPGDPEALAAALRKLADDRDELHRLRRAAADLAREAFTPAAVAGVLRDRLRSTVEAARP